MRLPGSQPQRLLLWSGITSKSDYIVGKMNINSSILSPIKSEKLTERFFSKRVKRINRKKAKKWLKKFDYAESTKTIRKALSRLSQKRSSLPY
mmetsp:Transcript_15029/g.14896  ORF Transcript_15029/g.14896 Transcript_15029/m.14896 type:complete len:93 (+) Transcript_15029:70-348(+)